MRIPKLFFIKENEWGVQFKWNLTYRNQKVDGLTDYTNLVIWIDRALSKEDKWKTFKHEWKHAVFDTYECGFNHSGLSLEDREEAQIRALDIEEEKFSMRWRRQ
jgi:hypothetical protein